MSQGLFSSADIDSGTKLLLKVFSAVLDNEAAADKPLDILDAGCGAGVIGICAAAALRATGRGAYVRCQDRDELARLLTAHNAGQNNIPPEVLEACTEPLLAGLKTVRWDMILTNIPAKAGRPVLEDFVRRSAGLLQENGKVIMVAVRTLTDFFEQEITQAGARILHEEKSPGHTVFVYGKGGPAHYEHGAAHENSECDTIFFPVQPGPGFLTRHPFYRRAAITDTAANIPLSIETVYGSSGFDRPSAAEHAVLTLIKKLETKLWNGPQAAAASIPILIHEGGQGFFPCRLYSFLREMKFEFPLVFSGRNILSLEAARHNYCHATQGPCEIVPAADLTLAKDILHITAARTSCGAGNAEGLYSLIIAFPELLPQNLLPKGVDQLASLWKSIRALLCPGGAFFAGFSSTDAERFDRKKPAGFTRLGDIKRSGFRALGYRGA